MMNEKQQIIDRPFLIVVHPPPNIINWTAGIEGKIFW